MQFKIKINHEFNVVKVESALFDMISLFTIQSMVDETASVTLTSRQKQQFYVSARAPVLKLQADLNQVYVELTSIYDSDSPEYMQKLKKLKEIQANLREARKNAANDIYERINSHGNMGIVDESDESVNIDLHGLHINEAKEKLNEIIFPFMSILKRVNLITGHGLHNQSGESLLKNAVKSFLNEKNLRCDEDIKNKGVLHLYSS